MKSQNKFNSRKNSFIFEELFSSFSFLKILSCLFRYSFLLIVNQKIIFVSSSALLISKNNNLFEIFSLLFGDNSS
jgi:hypothetical protein